MPAYNVNWSRFTVHKKHDIDRDKPYLWVFGIVIDVNTLKSHNYVVKRRCDSDNLGKKFGKGDTSTVPSDLDVSLDVTPLLGTFAGGVVVVAWENAMTSDAVIADAYDAAASDINEFVVRRLKAGGDLGTISDEEMAQVVADIKADVTKTIKSGWTVFQLLHDHEIGAANAFVTYDSSQSQKLDFRFISGSTDYELEGTMSYNADASLPSSPPPPPPPGKVLQSPKPQSTVRH